MKKPLIVILVVLGVVLVLGTCGRLAYSSFRKYMERGKITNIHGALLAPPYGAGGTSADRFSGEKTISA
jgi:hypothetical protein